MPERADDARRLDSAAPLKSSEASASVAVDLAAQRDFDDLRGFPGHGRSPHGLFAPYRTGKGVMRSSATAALDQRALLRRAARAASQLGQGGWHFSPACLKMS
jgi:hypothetical protein